MCGSHGFWHEHDVFHILKDLNEMNFLAYSCMIVNSINRTTNLKL